MGVVGSDPLDDGAAERNIETGVAGGTGGGGEGIDAVDADLAGGHGVHDLGERDPPVRRDEEPAGGAEGVDHLPDPGQGPDLVQGALGA